MGGGRGGLLGTGTAQAGHQAGLGNLSRLQDDGGGEGQVDKQELQAPRGHASWTLVSVVPLLPGALPLQADVTGAGSPP